MFFWFSSGNSGSRMGCCGGLMLLPLGFFMLNSGFGNNSGLLILLLVAVAAMFVLPRLMGGGADEKRKNDELYDEYEKPKRDEGRYVLGDDGEIIEVRDDEDLNRRANYDTEV
jgi:hypothetical protein